MQLPSISGSGESDPLPGCRESVTDAIAVLFLNVRSSDNIVRAAAEDELRCFETDDVDAFICALATLLATERPGDCTLRVQAAVALNHYLARTWISLIASSKEIVKNSLLRSVLDNLPTALRGSLFSAFVILVSCVCAVGPDPFFVEDNWVKLGSWPQFLTEFCSLLSSEVPHRRLNGLLLLSFLARANEGNSDLFLNEFAIVRESLETGLRDPDIEMQLAAVTATCYVYASLGCSEERNVQSLCPLILDVVTCWVENGHCSKAQSVFGLFACEGTWLFEYNLKEFAEFLMQMAHMFGDVDEEKAALSRTALETLVCTFEDQDLFKGLDRPPLMPAPLVPLLDPLLHLCIDFLAQLDICRGTFETGQMYIRRMAEALGCDVFHDPAFIVISRYVGNEESWRYRRAAVFAAAEVRKACQDLCEEHFDYIVSILRIWKVSDPQPEVRLAATTVIDLLK